MLKKTLPLSSRWSRFVGCFRVSWEGISRDIFWLTWVKRREEWKEFSQLETEKLVEPLSARAKVISQSHSSKVGLSGSSRIVDVLRNLVKKSGRRRSCQSKFLGPNKSPKSRCRFNWSDWSLLEQRIQQIPPRLSDLILSQPFLRDGSPKPLSTFRDRLLTVTPTEVPYLIRDPRLTTMRCQVTIFSHSVAFIVSYPRIRIRTF